MLNQHIKELKEKGVVITIQRLAILEYLHNNADHPTAEKIHKYLSEKYKTISLATVYNTLDMLKQAGVVHEINIGKEKRFDLATDSHHHFICRVCNKIIDVEIKCPMVDQEMVEGHKIESMQGMLFGVCADCRKFEEKE